jgi:hypothetical protein
MNEELRAEILRQVTASGDRGLRPSDVQSVEPLARVKPVCLELASKGQVVVGSDWNMRMPATQAPALSDEEICRTYVEKASDAFDPREAHLTGLRGVAELAEMRASIRDAATFPNKLQATERALKVSELRVAYHKNWHTFSSIICGMGPEKREAGRAFKEALEALEAMGEKP